MKQFLVVYVDDFKMAGPVETSQKAWDKLRKKLTLDKELPANLFLGCKHEIKEVTLPNGVLARKCEYNMEEYLQSTVQRFLDLAGPIKGANSTLKQVYTPFCNEEHKNSAEGRPADKPPGDCVYCPWCKIGVEINDINRKVPSPNEKAKSKDQEDASKVDPGFLGPIATRVLMKILYAARMARYDLLRAVCHLACNVSKWTSECDRRLVRLVSYIQSTLSYRMVGWVGDDLSHVQPHLYADADFAGCTSSQKSTNGLHHVLRGPNTCFPIHGASKRQSCVSVSTPEAEMVAGFYAMKTVGIPAMMIWERILPGKVELTVHEDNQAMIRVCETGRNPTMRFLGRVHRISIAWLHWVFAQNNIHLKYTVSSLMAADTFTLRLSRMPANGRMLVI